MNDRYVINELKLTNSFFGNQTIRFANGLNCIMGARGTGKTTLLEYIRFVLDLPPPSDLERQKQIETLLATNLGRGVIEALIENQDGLVYRVERSLGGEPKVFNSDGGFVDVLVRNLFSADVFAQGEIEAIASRPEAQLARLIDQFDDKALADLDSKRAAIADRLKQNSAEQLRVRNEIVRLKDSIQQAGDVEDQLTKMKKTIDITKTQEYSQIDAEQIKIRDADIEGEVLAAIDEWSNAIQSTLTEITEVTDSHKNIFHITSEYKGTNKKEIDDLRETISLGAKNIKLGIVRTQEELNQLLAKLDVISKQIKKTHAVQTKHYEELLTKYKAFQSDSKRIVGLQKKIDEKAKLTKAISEKESELQKLSQSRAAYKKQVADLIEQRFKKRYQIVTQLNAKLGDDVKVEIEKGALRSEYYSALMNIFYGSNLRYTTIVEKIVSYYTPEDLAIVIRSKDRSSLKSCLGIEDGRIDQILLHLAGDGESRLFEIESLSIDDKPLISLRIKEGDEHVNFRPSHQLSTGQKCTTVLPILLFKGTVPLIIDQPEDNLDNQYIYSAVVKLLQEVSPTRQLIFITHNPNIPVLGNAEFNLFLTSEEGRGAILKSGTIHDVKSEIIEYLEGGLTAFELREKFYAD